LIVDDLILTPDNIDFAELAEEPHDADKIVGPRAFRDETIAYLAGADQLSGATLPWKRTHDHIRFRPGEASLWIGLNGHGRESVDQSRDA
jgi:twinkle protein